METQSNPDPGRPNPMSLSGRTIIITGGAQGIGLAAAKLVADLGGNLVLVDMNAENLGAARDAIGTDACLTVAGNVSDPAFAPYAVEQAVARFGAVDGLV